VSRQITKYIGLHGLKNVGRVDEYLWRAAQPFSSGFTTLKEMGIKEIINLREEHNDLNKTEKLGFKYQWIPFDEKTEWKQIDFILQKMHEKTPKLIHCKHGQDRTGIICGCYRIRYNKWSFDEVFEEVGAYTIYGDENSPEVRRAIREFWIKEHG
jgi:protein tyrosine/serine phosphatase